MKVISSGRGTKGWSKEAICTGGGNGFGGCDAVLMVEQRDLFRTERHLYDGTTDVYATFQCPECGTWTDLGSYPQYLIYALPKRVPNVEI